MIKVINIFYVEDSEGDMELLEMCMSRYIKDVEVSLTVVENVNDAIKAFDLGAYSAALLDWNLPDGGGVDVAKHIRSQSNNFPIIFLSGAFEERHHKEAEQYNPKACLVKDYSKDSAENIIKLIQSAS